MKCLHFSHCFTWVLFNISLQQWHEVYCFLSLTLLYLISRILVCKSTFDFYLSLFYLSFCWLSAFSWRFVWISFSSTKTLSWGVLTRKLLGELKFILILIFWGMILVNASTSSCTFSFFALKLLTISSKVKYFLLKISSQSFSIPLLLAWRCFYSWLTRR